MSARANKIKLFLVDDHKFTRQAHKALLKEYEEIEISGEANEGRECLEKLPYLQTDVVLLDIHIKGLGGKETLVEITRSHPKIKVIMLSMFDDTFNISHCIQLGASAYLSKSCDFGEVLYTIRQVHVNGRYYSPRVTEALEQNFDAQRKIDRALKSNSISEKEKQIIIAIWNDKTSDQIAKEMNLSVHTIDFYKRLIYRKTNCHSNLALLKWAIKNGLVSV